MKKIEKMLSLLVCVVMIFSAIPFANVMTTAAEEIFVDGYYTYIVSDSKATIIKCDTSISGDITIPETLGDYTVVGIGDSAFAECYGITSVVIGSNIEKVGNDAFVFADNLKNVYVSENVSEIGEMAFSYCASLTDVEISEENAYYSSIDGVVFNKDETELVFYPMGKTESSYSIIGSVENITNYAFMYCMNLSQIEVDSDNTSYTVDDGVLFNSDKTEIVLYPMAKEGTAYTISDSVTKIADYAFMRNLYLTDVTLGANVEVIGEGAFAYNFGLQNVNIPDSVKTIDNGAFCDCISLENVTLGNNVVTIGEEAFSGCLGFTEVVLPDSVESVGAAAFYGCENLESIKLPQNITSIEDATFSNCYKLAEISIPESVLSIGYDAFYGCESLVSVDIPDSVASLGAYAFSGCTALERIIFTNSVNEISEYAFFGCESLANVYFYGTHGDWDNMAIDENEDLFAAEIHCIYGDLNDDDSVDALDMAIMKKELFNRFEVEVEDIFEGNLKYYDIDNDNDISILDMIKLKEILLSY